MLSCAVKVKTRKNVINRISESLPVAMEEVMKSGQEEALRNKKGNKEKELIPYEITSQKDNTIGRLYTDFEHAPFLEFGMGNKADGTLPHIGKTATFKASGMTYWYLPKAVADAKGREFSPQRLININGELYIMYATKPYPFMRPTAFYLEDKAIKIIAEQIRKQLRS